MPRVERLGDRVGVVAFKAADGPKISQVPAAPQSHERRPFFELLFVDQFEVLRAQFISDIAVNEGSHRVECAIVNNVD